MPAVECLICGREFYASPGHVERGWGKYCSMACRAIAYQGDGNPRYNTEVDDRVCLNCGRTFRKKPYAVSHGEGLYCSKKCHTDHRTVNKVCEYCGKPFNVYASRDARGDGVRFCSRECADAFRHPADNCTCIVCGKPFYTKQCELNSERKRGVGSFCSVDCKARYMSNHRKTVAGTFRHKNRGGKREDVGFYVRSSWEANYARYLKWRKERGQIYDWEYEPDTFEFVAIRRGSKFYTPDFKVWTSGSEYEYHEVKGYMDQKSATKLKRFKKYFPEEKLVIVDGPAYRKLASVMSGVIEEWE